MARQAKAAEPLVEDDAFDQRTKELEVQRRHEVSRMERVSNAQLGAITSFEDAAALLAEQYGDLKNVDEFELGTGFRVLKDKERLVDRSFIIVQYTFNEGDFGDGEFVSVLLVTKDGEKFVINDGGTGIFQDLTDISRSGRFGGILVPRGLRSSKYDTCPGCDQPRKKRTNPCTNLLSNDTECGNTSDERGQSATYYLNLDS